MTNETRAKLNVYRDDTDWFVAFDLDDCRARARACWGVEHQSEDDGDEWRLVPDDTEITIGHEGLDDIPEPLRYRATKLGPHCYYRVIASAREWADTYGEGGTGFLASTEW